MKTLPGHTSVSQPFWSTAKTRKTGSRSGHARIVSLSLSLPVTRLCLMKMDCTQCGTVPLWLSDAPLWVHETGHWSISRKTWSMTPSSTRRLWLDALTGCAQPDPCKWGRWVIVSTVWMAAISLEALTLLSRVTRQPLFLRSIVLPESDGWSTYGQLDD